MDEEKREGGEEEGRRRRGGRRKKRRKGAGAQEETTERRGEEGKERGKPDGKTTDRGGAKIRNQEATLWVRTDIKPLNLKPLHKENLMLWTIAIIMLVLWGLGLVSSYTMGGFIHVLLVLAVIVVVVNLIQGRGRV